MVDVCISLLYLLAAVVFSGGGGWVAVFDLTSELISMICVRATRTRGLVIYGRCHRMSHIQTSHSASGYQTLQAWRLITSLGVFLFPALHSGPSSIWERGATTSAGLGNVAETPQPAFRKAERKKMVVVKAGKSVH